MILQPSRILMSLLITTVIADNFEWKKDLFNNDCKDERQPVIEYYEQNGTQYLFFSQRVTWEEGRLLCKSYHARLATLDTIEKARGVARSLATSNIMLEDTWIGGRRIDFVWYWSEKSYSLRNTISMESNVEDYPPWSRRPIRPTKECLAIDRRMHEHPNFIDLDCRLQRPFICEKKAGDMITSPIPSKWVQINKNTFTLYYGKVSWQEAATFCRSKGARLAILKNSIVINILASSMTKTRPDFETVWIGAHFSYGQWMWMPTGSVLNSLTDENGYPPWRFGRSETNKGCLLLDRHINDNASFIEMSCDRTRDFVCEQYTDDEDDDWLNEPVKFSYENSTYIIYTTHKTWLESKNFCSERGSVFAHANHMNAINLIIEAMGDHPRGISHVWLGGNYDEKHDAWRWVGNGERIPKEKDEYGFPPWLNIAEDVNNDFDNSSCLNLDRSDHVRAHFYGLDCNSKQSFVCKITCDVPPPVYNGTWNCSDLVDGRLCVLQCDKGLIMTGVKTISCSFKNGWMSGQHLMEFPFCLKLTDYTSRMIRSLSEDMQKSSGYYLLLDHSLPAMKTISFKLAELVIQAYPISENLRAGMTTYMTDPPNFLPLNQTDSCRMLSSVYFMQNNIVENTTARPNVTRIYKDISMYNGRRILIIAVTDSERGIAYVNTLLRLKAAGHHIIIIGLKKDWELLLPLATIGFDRRANLFLLDEEEFDHVLRDMQVHSKKPACAHNKPAKNLTENYNAQSTETLRPIYSSTFADISTVNGGSEYQILDDDGLYRMSPISESTPESFDSPEGEP